MCWLNLGHDHVDDIGVIVGRRYLALMLVVTVAALGYLGVTRMQSAHAHSEDKKLAAADAASGARRTLGNKETAAVLATVARPASLVPAGGTTVPACHASAVQLCWSSSQSPAKAILPALAAVRRAGLTPEAVTCKAPPYSGSLGMAMGSTWRPCRSTIQTTGELTLSLVSFPLLVQHRVAGAPIRFDGSLISIEGQLLP